MAELATVARPYAEAAFRVASEHQQLDQWADWLDDLSTVVSAPEFEQLPHDPKVSGVQIVDLIASIASAKAIDAQVGQRFLMQLVEHDRLQALPEVAKQFRMMCDATKDVAEVKIFSAFALSDKELAELLPVLEKRFGMKLKPQVQIDESLIGGVCAVVGDDTLDMSVKARLEQMKLALTA